MKPKHKKQTLINQLKQYNTDRILKSQFNPTPFNLRLLSNPFLKDQQKYQYIVYKFKQYNKMITLQQIKDEYQVMVLCKLYDIMCNISNFQTKQDQISSVQQCFKWFKGQQKLIQQRKQQGLVRFKIVKQIKNVVQEKQKIYSQKSQKDQIVYNKVMRQMKPFKNKYRTIHKELDVPKKLLNNYKRKLINIVPYVQQKQQKKPPKIIYPKFQRFYKDQQQQDKLQVNDKPQQDKLNNQGKQQNKQGQQELKKQDEDPNKQQDLGGFGQQPQQPEQNDNDKDESADLLNANLKNYTIEWGDLKRKQNQKGYFFYGGSEIQIGRRIQNKYLKICNKKIKQQKQDDVNISYTNERANAKSKLQKNMQKKLQINKFKPKYSFIEQKQSAKERLNPQEQEKYGLNVSIKKKHKRRKSIDFSLPKINEYQQNYSKIQKTHRRDRLKSLRLRFGNLLNLIQYQQRDVSPSICQFTSRKRGFSEFLRDHSHSKERLKQINQVYEIKSKINQSKEVLNMKTLSKGLCEPQSQQYNLQNIIPSKDLPSNPFMVQTKKKKK